MCAKQVWLRKDRLVSAITLTYSSAVNHHRHKSSTTDKRSQPPLKSPSITTKIIIDHHCTVTTSKRSQPSPATTEINTHDAIMGRPILKPPKRLEAQPLFAHLPQSLSLWTWKVKNLIALHYQNWGVECLDILNIVALQNFIFGCWMEVI